MTATNKATPGDVLLTKEDVYIPSLGYRVPAGRERPVIVLSSADGSLNPDLPDVQVAPVSLRVEMAADHDVIVRRDENPIGAAIIVEVWNARPVLVSNLGLKIGRLAQAALARIVAVHNAMYTGEPIDGNWCGAPIEDDSDARASFRRAELAAAHYLSEPVDEMLRIADTGATTRLMWVSKLAKYVLGESLVRPWTVDDAPRHI